MDNFLILIAANILSILLACAGIYMAINGIAGWGWFLFGALLTTVGIKTSKSSKKEKKDDVR